MSKIYTLPIPKILCVICKKKIKLSEVLYFDIKANNYYCCFCQDDSKKHDLFKLWYLEYI